MLSNTWREWITLFLLCSVSASLPSPQSAWMDAVNTRFILRWDWNTSQPSDNITFTADYTFSNGDSYTTVCNGSRMLWCNFSGLYFHGAYIIRVRAEAGLDKSNWTSIRFIPDEHALLGPPLHVVVEGGNCMLTVTITPPESYPLRLNYQVEFWEKLKHEQKYHAEYELSHGILDQLEPWTAYCVRAMALDKNLNKMSSFTPEQCTQTKGHTSDCTWITPVLICVCLVTVASISSIIYIKRKRPYQDKKTSSLLYLQTLPRFSQLLLKPEEENCSVVTVQTLQIKQQRHQSEQDPLQDLPRAPEEHSLIVQNRSHNDSSGHDSGISSGEDSTGRHDFRATQKATDCVTVETVVTEAPVL